jgi:magnesium chelatase subunit D
MGHLYKDRRLVPLLVLISDGKANVSLYGGDPVEDAITVAKEIRARGINSLIIDTEQGFLNFGLMRQLSDEMGGKYLKLKELNASTLASAVRNLEN